MTESIEPDEPKEDLSRKCLICQELYSSEVTMCPKDKGMVVPLFSKEVEDPFVGTTLGENYDIVAIAGTGGMGVVYQGQHRALDRKVAIKMLKSEFVQDEKSYLRFQVEALAASRLTHPNVVALYDYGVAQTGQPFLIMEFIEGTSLASEITRHGALTVNRAMPIFLQACNALEHAHHNNIIHRDVKPSNTILIEIEGQPDLVKIVDFGIAQIAELREDGLKLTKTGEIFGSPVYMSPEQCTGDAIDERTDIYSMGTLMYETLTGVAPFVGSNAIDTIQKKFSENPKPFLVARPNSTVAPEIEAVIMKALERDPNRRFQSMSELKNALEASSRGFSVVARSMVGAPAPAIPSEFAGMDLRKEVELASMSAHKLSTRAKAARMLVSDKESAPVQVEKLKSSVTIKEAKPPLLPFAAALIGVAGIGYGIYSFMNSSHSVVGKLTAVNLEHRKAGSLSFVSNEGKSYVFASDGKTQVTGRPRKGAIAQIVYSENNGKLHADKIMMK